MKKLGSMIKSAIWEDDNILTKPPAAPAAQPQMSAYSPTPVIGVDPQIRQTLIDSLNASRMGGFEYLKFAATLEEMKAMNPDEAIRFKTVFVMAKQFEIDKSKLIASAQHYIQVLQRDLQQFRDAIPNKQATTIGVWEARISVVDKEVASRNEQILKLNEQVQKLNAEIAQFQQEKATLSGQITDKRNQNESVKKAFEATQASCVSEIETTIQKINQYIQ